MSVGASDAQPQPAPATPAKAETIPMDRVSLTKWAFERFGIPGVLVALIAPWAYQQANEMKDAHIGMVKTVQEASVVHAKNDTEKTNVIEKISETLSRTTDAVEKQTDLIREIKDEHRDMKLDIRDIQRNLGSKAVSVKPSKENEADQ